MTLRVLAATFLALPLFGSACASVPPRAASDASRCAADDDDCRAQALGELSIGWLRLGLSIADLTAELGPPATQTEPEEWGADGLFHATLEWPDRGVSVSVAGADADAPAAVESFTVRAPFAARTDRGIGIGATEAEVTAAYADVRSAAHSQPGQELVAGSLYGGLFFYFESGRVTSIFAGAAAE